MNQLVEIQLEVAEAQFATTRELAQLIAKHQQIILWLEQRVASLEAELKAQKQLRQTLQGRVDSIERWST